MMDSKTLYAFVIVAVMLVSVGMIQSWNVAFSIFNLCIICAVMALGVNIQWGYGGLFNVGIMGFAALGGMTALLVSKPPITKAWEIAGGDVLLAFVLAIGFVVGIGVLVKKMKKGKMKLAVITMLIIGGIYIVRGVLDPAVVAIEANDPSKTGYLGGAGLPIIFSWGLAAIVAAGVAWVIGKVALGLRADYLAIATLGISEIIIAFMKNEDWLTRGVKNATGLQRPVPYEINLQSDPMFQYVVGRIYGSETSQIVEASGLFVKMCYSGLFLVVLVVVYLLCAKALDSSWGRMMRAIRDNEIAAAAIGKNITKRHLQLFILGSAVVGIAGAMLTTLEGQFTPSTYHPLRYTFLIWVMVVVGGSGNNAGAVLGGFLVWFVWIEAEPAGQFIIQAITQTMDENNPIAVRLDESAQYMRLIIMGSVLLIMMRMKPKGLIPENVSK